MIRKKLKMSLKALLGLALIVFACSVNAIATNSESETQTRVEIASAKIGRRSVNDFYHITFVTKTRNSPTQTTEVKTDLIRNAAYEDLGRDVRFWTEKDGVVTRIDIQWKSAHEFHNPVWDLYEVSQRVCSKVDGKECSPPSLIGTVHRLNIEVWDFEPKRPVMLFNL